jgi:predicted ATP-grasp superfamily ATP-dependent carboligase
MPSTGAVLVPTGRQMKSYACLRSLGQRGIPTILATECDTLPHFASRFCAERASLSSPHRDLLSYRDDLLDIARRSDVTTIVPVREFDTYLLAKYRDRFEDHVSLVTPSMDVLERAHDRFQLAEAAADAGVPVAETQLLSEVEAWTADGVVKPRYNLLTSHYIDTYSPGTAVEQKAVTFVPGDEDPDTEQLRQEMDHDPIVQAFVPEARKHLYCALWDHGEPLATYQHRQLRKNSWVGGGGVYRESTDSEEVESVAHDLLSHLDWHGLACIEYVKDERTGEWKFLEINPRVWQSMTEAVRVGADFPYYYWLRATGRAEEIDPSYERGIASHIAYGELSHLQSVRRDDSPFLERPSITGTLWDIARTCVTEPRFDYIRRDDPKLFLSALRATLDTGVTRSRDFGSTDPTPARTATADGGTVVDSDDR